MAALPDRPDHSWREDGAVPGFDDTRPLAVMDGACVLCSWGARTIARLDREEAFRICPVQSPLGSALVRHFEQDPEDPQTWLFLDQGKAWSGMDAIIRIGERLGGVGRLASLMRILPAPLRDWLYRRIAFNRYRFGRTDMCALPDEALRRRLID